jgi:hypothetical protein
VCFTSTVPITASMVIDGPEVIGAAAGTLDFPHG